MYFIVYLSNGNVDVIEAEDKTFWQVADEKGYSLLYLSYFEKTDNKETRNFKWNGKEWVKKIG